MQAVRFLGYISFYILGLTWIVFLMLSLHTYNRLDEICMGCKVVGSSSTLYLILILIFQLRSFPYIFLGLLCTLFCCSILIRGLSVQDRREKKAEELSKSEHQSRNNIDTSDLKLDMDENLNLMTDLSKRSLDI